MIRVYIDLLYVYSGARQISVAQTVEYVYYEEENIAEKRAK